MRKISRRSFLMVAGALSATALLAACGGSNGGNSSSAANNSNSSANDGANNSASSDAGNGGDAGSSAKTYKVGICQLVQHDALDAASNGFMDAVAEGLGEGNVEFDYQNAQGESTMCATICTGFVANSYDLIMANATPALQAAMAATSDIPILGTSVTDYGSALNDPDMDPAVGTGVNVSGTSDGVPGQLYADLTLELVPDVKKVAILYCSAEVNSVVQAEDFIAAMNALNVETQVFTFTDSNDIQAVCNSAIEGADAMYIPTDNTAASNMTIVNNVCQPVKMPIICGEENMCRNGGLATVSISYYDIGYLCGEMAVKILKDGADVSKMPIGYSENPVKKYNADYANAIGFTMPAGFDTID